MLAHEYGHHVQDLLGTEAEVAAADGARPGQRQPVLGDAGTAGRLLRRRLGEARRRAPPTRPASRCSSPITQQDIAEALEAAAAVGDDAIQKKMGGGVDESKFTHGSSAQRQQWFNRGYTSGDPKGCDTFGNAL